MKRIATICLLVATSSYAQEQELRIFTSKDIVKVPDVVAPRNDDEGDGYISMTVTREWVQEQARKEPDVRFYWRESPVRIERIYGNATSKASRVKPSPSETATVAEEKRQDWESYAATPNFMTHEKIVNHPRRESRTYTIGELRPQWVESRYIGGRYEEGHFKYVPVTEQYLSELAAKDPNTDYYKRYKSSSESSQNYRYEGGQRYQPESKEVTEWRSQNAAKEAAKANEERLWGKPLTTLPRR